MLSNSDSETNVPAAALTGECETNKCLAIPSWRVKYELIRGERSWKSMGGGGHRCESSVISKSVCLSVSGKPAEPRVATLYLDTFCY